MNEIVFILGAGASAHAGTPMMANFLDRARELKTEWLPDKPTPEFDLVFRAISNLQRVHSKSQLDLVNLESLFGVFEMAKLIGTCPGLSPEEVGRLSDSMRRVIVETLQDTTALQIDVRTLIPSRDYARFVKIVRTYSSPVITFNYDAVLDHAFRHANLDVDYGLTELPHVGIYFTQVAPTGCGREHGLGRHI